MLKLKLDNKKLGLFRVLKEIGMHARHLELLVTIQIHPIFHISLLEPSQKDSKDAAINHFNAMEVNGKDNYQVEKILDCRIAGWSNAKKRQYLMK